MAKHPRTKRTRRLLNRLTLGRLLRVAGVLAVLFLAWSAAGCRPVAKQVAADAVSMHAEATAPKPSDMKPAAVETACAAQQAFDDAVVRLEQERAAWEAHEPRHYSFQSEVGNEFDPYSSIQMIEVKDGKRVALVKETPGVVDLVPVACFSDTLDTIFGCARAALAESECGCTCALEWKITYDSEYHYIESFYIANPDETDSGSGFAVTQFIVLD